MNNLTRTLAIDGAEPTLVAVECSTTSGFAGLHLVGNTSEMCRDGKERAKTALEKLGLRFGQKRVLINLSPADSRKEGNHFDLPMAVSLASLAREEPMAHNPADWIFAAELSLEGQLRPIRAVISMVMRAQKSGLKGLILARAHRKEISVFQALPSVRDSLQILYFDELKEVLEWLFHGVIPVLPADSLPPDIEVHPSPDFDDMHLSPELEDLAAVCAHGRHSLLLRGTPGSGKSMFAQRLPSLMRRLPAALHIETLQTHSLLQERLPPSLIAGHPPFRHPHHASSAQAILGTAYHPGDLALAHGGLLFLDELPEFRRDLLEALREPLENGRIQISRAQKKTEWLADVQFLAACNNCPCGWSGSRRRLCRCSQQKVAHYRLRLSGPILDRIDIHFNMPDLSSQEWRTFALKENDRSRTQALRERIQRAEDFASNRLTKLGINANSSLSQKDLPGALHCSEATYQGFLTQLDALKLSNRAVLRAFRVARTLADLDAATEVQARHVARAAQWQHYQAARARGEVMD